MNKSLHNSLETHANKITKIIERLESNHFKWYVIHISILGFVITLYSFVFSEFQNMEIILKIVLFTIIGISINLISLITFYNSWKFLKLGRAFRNMEQKTIFEGIIPEYNWKKYQEQMKKGFTFWTSFFISIIILVTSILIPFLYFL